MTNIPQILRVRVARKETLALDIASFELVSTDGTPLPSFSAGSHVDVSLAGGMTRQYSLCNDPGESHRYQIAVLKDAKGRGGSRAMHDTVQEGDILSINAPRNHFPLAHGARQHLLLAGGIGITPLLCMAEKLSAIEQPFSMHYCTRSADRTAFRERIGQSRYAPAVQFHFDDGPGEQKLDIPALLKQPQQGIHVYTCGPKGFMDAVLSAARQSGWPEEQLHYEFFGAEPVKLATDGSFEVKLASSGRVIRVAADQTVIAALAAEGVQVPTSCEQGVCGTCLTRVLEGEPDHRDLYLTPEEQAGNDQFLPCCSRAKSGRLVLDL
jgi:vanillate O-demethylase ferredoxin subunit